MRPEDELSEEQKRLLKNQTWRKEVNAQPLRFRLDGAREMHISDIAATEQNIERTSAHTYEKNHIFSLYERLSKEIFQKSKGFTQNVHFSETGGWVGRLVETASDMSSLTDNPLENLADTLDLLLAVAMERYEQHYRMYQTSIDIMAIRPLDRETFTLTVDFSPTPKNIRY